MTYQSGSAAPSACDIREKTETLEVKTNLDAKPTPDKSIGEPEKIEEEKEGEPEPAPKKEK